jgi:secreted protein with Ig-like and vWFA domain
MIDYATILSRKYEGSEWTLEGDDYSGLNWHSDSPKPSKKTLDDLWESVQAEIEAEKAAKVDLKASAIAKLAALGLTEDEAKAIIG